MFGTALPILQPLADSHGFGMQWFDMSRQRTKKAAMAATLAAWAATWAAEAARAVEAWAELDPCGLLLQLIELP